MRPERPGSFNISLTAEAWRQAGIISADEFNHVLNALQRVAAAAARAPSGSRPYPGPRRITVGELEATFELEPRSRVLMVISITRVGADDSRSA